MKLKLFIFVLALQSAWVLYTVAVQEYAWSAGKVILLETERVDPRDLLRGDYLILNYKISSVPTNLFSPPVKRDLPAGTKVYVALEPHGEFFALGRASTNQFEPPANQVLLQARSNWRIWNATNVVHVEYGLERYYVREGTGNPRGKLTVQAVVPASGRASIKQVFLDGKPYAEAMKEASR
ncbi:MAG: GDYXXLXY domain-containing protein [Verrucomicrobia bacterium]|jgi:uncharacterized membrane-anchored protein|nr:GDYXXLXY domain-containing protein [Verrucomicrobiota bacterium]